MFLDCDGVLADFEPVPARARRRLGAVRGTSRQREFWRRLATTPMSMARCAMPDGRRCSTGAHLRPTILTGLPIGNGRARKRSPGPSVTPRHADINLLAATRWLHGSGDCGRTTARIIAQGEDAGGVRPHRNAVSADELTATFRDRRGGEPPPRRDDPSRPTQAHRPGQANRRHAASENRRPNIQSQARGGPKLRFEMFGSRRRWKRLIAMSTMIRRKPAS